MGTTQVIDTEYGFRGGDHDCESRFEPVVFCAIDVDTGERFHTWGRDAKLRDWLNEHRGDCFVAHNAIAEMKYLLRLGIDLPERWYDTMIAYRYATNSISRLPAGLDKALLQEGLDEWLPDNKQSLQAKIGCLDFDGNSPEELREIARYCYQDCEATAALYARIKDRVPVTWLPQNGVSKTLRSPTLVELWSWRGSHDELCDRTASPWDDPERRPSHADRRKALRQQIMQAELSTLKAKWWLPQKIIEFTERLVASAA